MTPTFEHIGGHPLIDFVNTKTNPGGQPVDQLACNEDIVFWMIDVGMIEVNTVKLPVSDAPHLLAQVREFRLHMRTMLDTVSAGQPVPAETIAEINGLLAQWQGRPQLIPEQDAYAYQFDHALTQPAHLLAMLADAAADFVANVEFQYVKQCNKSTCIRYFLDTSRNHSRRWCSMEKCGNRHKARVHYARKKGE